MRFMNKMTGGQVFFLLLTSVATVAVVLSLLLTDKLAIQLMVAALVSFCLYLAARQFVPPVAYRMRTIRYAIWVFSGLFIVAVGFRSFVDAFVINLVQEFTPNLEVPLAFIEAPTGLILIFIVIMYAITLVCLQEGSPRIPAPYDPHIKVASYRDLQRVFVRNLEFDLARVDEELRWSHAEFISLDAEVDVRNESRRKKRTLDLVSALKENQEADIFVVIGVPGAGKSVALRKCCRDLLDAHSVGERIPVYVNLKEWTSTSKWSATTGPDDDEFSDFVRKNIKNRLPNNMKNFFDEHFDRMVASGELFFVFDSFDEIPGILDVDETSKLLKTTSDVVVRYLQGGANGRGIIASRYYRRPRLGQAKHVQLDVRPFSDRQIASVIRTGPRSDELLHIIYQERLELGSLARNPFSLSLLMDYWKENDWTVPQNQSELYRSYIDQSLKDASDQISEIGLTIPEFHMVMEDISYEMFQKPGHGLEMTVREIRATLENQNADEIIDVLISARLARKASRTQSVSFVHRRFNEYFIVTRWLSGTIEAPLEAIASDGRSRDALVLYSEVADDLEAKRIAQFCWAEISKGLDSAVIQLPVVYCLRFLVEAFRARSSSLEEFRGELSELVSDITQTNDDIMLRKISVEAIGLLPSEGAENALKNALSISNSWIAETAISACRYLPQLPKTVSDRLFQALSDGGPAKALLLDKDLMFALSLSGVFTDLRCRLRMWQIDLSLALLSGFICFLIVFATQGYITTLRLLGGVSVMLMLACLAKFLPDKKEGKLRVSPAGASRVFFRYISGHYLLHNLVFSAFVLFPIFLLLNLGVDLAGVPDSFRTVASKVRYTDVPFLCLVSVVCLVFQMRIGSLFWVLKNEPRYFFYRLFSVHMFWKIVRYGVAPLLILSASFLVISSLSDYQVWIFSIVSVGLLFFSIIVPSLFLVVSFWKKRRHNLDTLRSVKSKFVANRAQIARNFERFDGSQYRLLYAEWIALVSNDPEHLVALSKSNWEGNPWPNEQRPNFGDDPGSILLAQLDGRWLGLEVY